MPVEDGKAFQRALYERHRIEVPVFETSDGWAMRVSIQGYNDDRDVDALLAALGRAALELSRLERRLAVRVDAVGAARRAGR